jgi:hypothetical protein
LYGAEVGQAGAGLGEGIDPGDRHRRVDFREGAPYQAEVQGDIFGDFGHTHPRVGGI